MTPVWIELNNDHCSPELVHTPESVCHTFPRNLRPALHHNRSLYHRPIRFAVAQFQYLILDRHLRGFPLGLPHQLITFLVY
ncbi:MAG: hypothetical protein EBY83_03450 [Verrucomicrobia bacterium]|nr:hypothetical protein [Verrucomicrobiota bacterium]